MAQNLMSFKTGYFNQQKVSEQFNYDNYNQNKDMQINESIITQSKSESPQKLVQKPCKFQEGKQQEVQNLNQSINDVCLQSQFISQVQSEGHKEKIQNIQIQPSLCKFIKAEVQYPKFVKQGFISIAEIYTIKIQFQQQKQILDIEIERSWSQFESLYYKLCQNEKHLLIPTFPEKTYVQEAIQHIQYIFPEDQQFYLQRLEDLNLFLEILINSPELLKSTYVYEFLNQSDFVVLKSDFIERVKLLFFPSQQIMFKDEIKLINYQDQTQAKFISDHQTKIKELMENSAQLLELILDKIKIITEQQNVVAQLKQFFEEESQQYNQAEQQENFLEVELQNFYILKNKAKKNKLYCKSAYEFQCRRQKQLADMKENSFDGEKTTFMENTEVSYNELIHFFNNQACQCQEILKDFYQIDKNLLLKLAQSSL